MPRASKTVTYRGTKKFKPKEFRKVVKAELQRIVLFWWKKFLPKHFSTRAQYYYRYRHRTKLYNTKKMSKKGHKIPLVFTGNLKRMVTQSVKISGSSKRAQGKLNAPNYTYMYQKSDSGHVDKAAELTVMTEKEIQTMTKEIDRRVQAIHDKDRSTEKK